MNRITFRNVPIALFAALVAVSFPVTAREVPNLPVDALVRSPIDITGSVTDVQRSRGLMSSRTDWTFSILVEHVHHSGLPDLKVSGGQQIVITARTQRLRPGTVGSTGHRSTFGGPNGLPQKGDRVRVHAERRNGELVAAFPNGFCAPGTRITVIAADDEYESYVTMPALSAELDRFANITSSVIVAADPAARTPDPTSKTANTGVAALNDAHVCVVFMRFSRDEELANELADFARSGRPIVGFRTSTHAFALPQESPVAWMNERFGAQVFGAPWRSHHGHSSRTKLHLPAGVSDDHPVLRGLAGALAEGITVRSWLYEIEPLGDGCIVLLEGEAIDSEREGASGRRQPVLWVREAGEVLDDPNAMRSGHAPRRMAFTTLGHPDDLEHPVVRLLAGRMILWAAGEERLIDEMPRPAPQE